MAEAASSLRVFEWFGHLGEFCARVVRAATRRRFEVAELVRQMDEIGARSAPLIFVAGAAIGVVLTLETRNRLIRVGAESSLPAVIMVSILRETGPIITGLIKSGRIGAGIAAELGSMKVTDQIDAMEVSAVNPLKYLAATRILACALMLPLLTLICDFSGILVGWIVNTLAHPISLQLFLDIGLKHLAFKRVRGVPRGRGPPDEYSGGEHVHATHHRPRRGRGGCRERRCLCARLRASPPIVE